MRKTVHHRAPVSGPAIGFRSVRSLIGVSGGADSVALLHLLVESGFRKLIVCHLDHRLRGRNSTQDARFVARLAVSLGLPFEIGSVDVRQLMKARGESLETAARHARHAFFAGCARKHRSSQVFLAHHADDQAETVLWNLLRGSHGLKGMREEQRITVDGTKLQLIRPLLDLRHSQLIAWLKSQGHRWREDASNRQAVAIRNRLRNEVFPLLNEISGRDAVAAFVRGADDAAVREDFDLHAIEQADLLDPQGRVHLPALRKLPSDLQCRALHKYLMDHGIPSIGRKLVDCVGRMLDPSAASSVNLPGGKRLRRREGRLWIEAQSSFG